MTRDPRRLDQSPDCPPEIHEMLHAARTDGPAPGELARLLARLDGLATAQPAAATTRVAFTGATRAALWIVGVVAAVAMGTWLLRGNAAPDRVAPAPDAPSPTVPAPAPQVTPDPVPDRPPPPRPAAPVGPGTLAVPDASRARPPRATVRRPRQRSAAPAPAEPEPVASEASLVAAARARLRAGELAPALALTRQHRQRFPDGLLREEREAIAIETLLARGHQRAARTRMDAFVRDFPASSYRAHLEHQLEGRGP